MMVVDKGKCTIQGKTINEFKKLLSEIILDAGADGENNITTETLHNCVNKLIQEAFESGTVLEKESNFKKLTEAQDTTNYLLQEIQTLLRDRLS